MYKRGKSNLEKPCKLLTILRIANSIGETSAPYNQFSLALIGKYDLTICTYFKSNLLVPKEIKLFEGNGSLTDFFRVLVAALKEKEYDIIHVHSLEAGILFLLATLFKDRKLLSSTVFTVHNSYSNFKFKKKLMLIPVFVFFRTLVCCSQSSFESFPGFFKWLAGDRLCVVQNGVDIDRIDRIIGTRHQKIRNDNFTILAVGRLIQIKNVLTLLNAFHKSDKHLESILMFIGGGVLRDSLLEKRKSLDLGKQVELVGLIPREKVYQKLSEADLFISTSWGEGLPIAVLEAMACSCPVVLSDISPHREIAEGTDFIPLIRPDDVEGFTQEINRFRKMSTSARKKIGEECRKLVEEKFSLTAMYRGYKVRYNQLLGNINSGQ